MPIKPGCLATYFSVSVKPYEKIPVRVLEQWGRTRSGFVQWRVERLDMPATAPKSSRILRVAYYSLHCEEEAS